MQWVTIRLLIILLVRMNLATMRVNYTFEFLHTKSDDKVYVEMPSGFEKDGKVLN